MWIGFFIVLLVVVDNRVQSLLIKPSQRFLVINCEDIPWEPISFFDMYRNNMDLGSDSRSDSWTACNVACGESLPIDVYEYDGIILTGSHYNCRPREVYFSWYEGLMILIRTIAEMGKPNLFGGCFGHNLIALALGGTIGLNPNKKYVLQIETLRTNNAFQELFSSSNFKNNPRNNLPAENILENYSLISTHEDCVLKLPKTATLLGSSTYCENHFFLAGKKNNILALQSHPEFDLQYAVLDRIWIGVVKKRKLLSKDEISCSLESFQGYDDAEARKLCGLISCFLRMNPTADER